MFETDIKALLKEKGPGAAAQRKVAQGLLAGEVLVDAKPLLRLHTAAGGFTPKKRAQLVARRLNHAMECGLTSRDLRVASRNGETVVLAGTVLLVTADRAEARSNRIAPHELARIWRDRLASALSGERATR